jgi:hypothetical protein
MTFWSGIKSSAESRREKPSSASEISSAKNSKVLVLKASANFENISEICGCFDVVEVVVSMVSVMTKWENCKQ